jgi:hypothetical protein
LFIVENGFDKAKYKGLIVRHVLALIILAEQVVSTWGDKITIRQIHENEFDHSRESISLIWQSYQQRLGRIESAYFLARSLDHHSWWRSGGRGGWWDVLTHIGTLYDRHIISPAHLPAHLPHIHKLFM